MKPELTTDTFAKLLDCLDADRERAGEKYEDLRRTLLRFFEWRGAPFPEDHTDETFNRVAVKIGQGIEIKNVGGYCYEVARLVFMESLKAPDSKRVSLEAIDHKTAGTAPPTDEAVEKELRLDCLEVCLRGLPPESSKLITEYYRHEKRGRIDHRQTLADSLGLRRDALANRAQRVRDKLESCVMGCLKKKRAI